jgi:hypothetical protein
MTCQHCNRRPAEYRTSVTEASPSFLICTPCIQMGGCSEFADLTPVTFVADGRGGWVESTDHGSFPS